MTLHPFQPLQLHTAKHLRMYCAAEKGQSQMEKPHKRLLAWQKSMSLVVSIYQLTKSFPRDETYALTSQIRRAAVSVPSNISEGAAGRSVSQFRNSLSVAIGSLNEVSTQLEIAYRVGYLDKNRLDETESLVDECLALTYGLRKSLKEI